MQDRINTPLTNEHFVAFCQSMVGQPYWYGTCVYKCTESLRSRKAAQYPSHYGSSRTSRYLSAGRTGAGGGPAAGRGAGPADTRRRRYVLL